MKKFIALMLSLLMCFAMVFVSCKDNGDESSSSEETPSAEVSGLPTENTSGDNVIEF